MSNWQSFKKKHVLLMNAAFTVAIPAAVWLIMPDPAHGFQDA